jgi:hypothetical protein
MACHACEHTVHGKPHLPHVMAGPKFAEFKKLEFSARELAQTKIDTYEKLYARISGVLDSVDCASVQTTGFAHLFKNLFTPLEEFTWFKHLKLKSLKWETLKCDQVIIRLAAYKYVN